MRALSLAFSHRFIVLTLCVLATLALSVVIAGSMLSRWDVPLGLALLAFLGLSCLGFRDLLQTRHSILRNYPIAAHLRFLLEDIRPEIRQYFFEGENDGLPFPRDQRAVVYQRAKLALDKRPFGTQFDVYAPGYEWLQPFASRRSRSPTQPFRVTVGGPDCSQALFGLGLQHLRDELRLAERQRHPRAQRGREARRLRP